MSQFNKSPFSFKAPSKFNSQTKFNNKDALFNKKKISNEVLSMSSASSSCSSSGSSRSGTTTSTQEDNNRDDKRQYDDDDDDDEEVDSEIDNEEESQEDDEEAYDKYETYQKDKKKSVMSELNEKRDLLYQMDRLESKGYKLPFKFNMETDIDEMRSEYNKLIKEKEIDASIRFQRKMMMAFVTGSEYLNTRYDPFSIRLDGWSEQVHDNILDYDDIFEELHLKYKSTGKKMSPELRLFISLSGSAFMFHLTSRMFKETPLPDVENVLRSNPELMKQFQQAATKQYITGNTNTQQRSNPQDNGMNSGLFGMVSNMFNNLGGGPSRPKMYRDEDEASEASVRKYNKPRRDIDSIINNVHSKISFDQEQNNIETLSVSDEEITSIIEDTADIRILKNAKNNKNTRTLNL